MKGFRGGWIEMKDACHLFGHSGNNYLGLWKTHFHLIVNWKFVWIYFFTEPLNLHFNFQTLQDLLSGANTSPPTWAQYGGTNWFFFVVFHYHHNGYSWVGRVVRVFPVVNGNGTPRAFDASLLLVAASCHTLEGVIGPFSLAQSCTTWRSVYFPSVGKKTWERAWFCTFSMF